MDIIGHVTCYPRHDQTEALEVCRELAATAPERFEVYHYKGRVRFTTALPVDHPAYLRLVEVCQQYGVEWHHRQEATYSQQEIDSAELLRVRITRSVTQVPAEASGTRVRMVSCPRCRMSYHVQQGELVLRGARGLTGLSWGRVEAGGPFWMVSADLARLLAEWETTGLSFGDVRTSRGMLLPLKQVIPTWTLPDLAPTTRFFRGDKVCPECQRYGLYPLQLHYRRADMGDIHDVGFAPVYYSRNILAEGGLIISQRLHRCMKEARVKGYRAEPVAIV